MRVIFKLGSTTIWQAEAQPSLIPLPVPGEIVRVKGVEGSFRVVTRTWNVGSPFMADSEVTLKLEAAR